MLYLPRNQLRANQSATLASRISRNLKYNNYVMKNAAMAIYLEVFVWHAFISVAGSYGNYVKLFTILRNIFSKQLHHFTFLQQCMRVEISPHPRQHLLLSTFYYSHHSICEVASHCGFDLHFCNGQWCRASLHILIGHLYMFFGEMCIKILCLFVFLLLLL